MDHKRLKAFVACLFMGGLAVVPLVWRITANMWAVVLEVTMTSSAPGWVQVYTDIGAGFTELPPARARVVLGGAPSTLRFRLPNARISSIRLDPLDGAGTVTIHRARFCDGNGMTLWTVSPAGYVPAHQIGSLRVSGDALLVTTTPRANNPELGVHLWNPLTPNENSTRAVLLIEALLGLLAAGAWWCSWRIVRTSPTSRR